MCFTPHNRDTDGDKLNDLRERDFGTSLRSADSDADGVSDVAR